MSVQSEINRIEGNIASAYTAVSGKGGTLPAAQNSANLPAAIESIPSGKPEQSKTLTLGAAAPSTVTPDSGKVLSSVPVVLDTSVIKAENIAKDVTMLGITGTHEGGGSGIGLMSITNNRVINYLAFELGMTWGDLVNSPEFNPLINSATRRFSRSTGSSIVDATARSLSRVFLNHVSVSDTDQIYDFSTTGISYVVQSSN